VKPGPTWANVLAGVALVLVGSLLLGCGSGGGDASGNTANPSYNQSYSEVLHGMRIAAFARRTYDARGRAEGLEPGKRAVIRSFCDFSRGVTAGNEAWKLPKHLYVAHRIRSIAAYKLNPTYLAELGPAMSDLDAVVHLRTLTGKRVRGYARACHR
jgi:hypothetical protein